MVGEKLKEKRRRQAWKTIRGNLKKLGLSKEEIAEIWKECKKERDKK